jgi:outer membrane lipoprotein-sorting protein
VNAPAVNILRRLPLSRLLLVCVLVVAVGASLTALAFALGSGPTPPPKPLAQAVHDALNGASQESIQGASADVTLTDHLLEGASLTTGGQGGGQGGGELTSNPLVTGASGRLWISGDGRVRLELQSEKGDTQILYDGHTLSLYDAASNTLYRYTPPAHSNGAGAPAEHHQVPSVANVEEAIAKLSRNANVSGATPGDVGGQPAYTVHVSPKEGGSLLGGAELSFDAVHGVPLRAAIYSTESASPAIELAASNVSYGAVPDSVFAFTPPSNAKVEEVQVPARDEQQSGSSTHAADKPKITTHGHGLSTIAVVQAAAKAGSGDSAAGAPEGLPQVKINGVSATELGTELGTVLSFERSGVRYLLAGSVSPAAIEAFARGL